MSDQSRQITTKIDPRDAIVPREDDTDVVVEAKTLSNAELRKLAAERRPPAEWFAGDEEDIF